MSNLGETTPATNGNRGNSLYDRFMSFLARPVPVSRGFMATWSLIVSVVVVTKVTYDIIADFDVISLMAVIVALVLGSCLVVRVIGRRQAKAHTKHAAVPLHPQVGSVLYTALLTLVALWVAFA